MRDMQVVMWVAYLMCYKHVTHSQQKLNENPVAFKQLIMSLFRKYRGLSTCIQ